MQTDETSNSVTEFELDLSKLPKGEHRFVQRGGFITCTISGHHHGHRIPPHKSLTMQDGKYHLVDDHIHRSPGRPRKTK